MQQILENKIQRRALLSALLLMLGYAVFNYTPGYFMQSRTESLDCSRPAYSTHSSIISVAAILTAPFFGHLIKDMKWIRKMVALGIAVGGLSYVLASRIQSIWQLYAIAAILGTAANNCTMVCSMAVLAHVFQKNAGVPTGIAMSGSGLCGSVISLILPKVIEQQGWRTGYLLLAALWMLLLLLAYCVLGTLQEKGPAVPLPEVEKAQEGFTYRQAMRTPTMILLTAVTLIICINMVFLQHMPAFYVELGRSPAAAGRFVSMFSLTLVLAKVVIGGLYDRLGAKITTMLCAAGYAAGMWIQLSSNGNSLLLGLGIVISVLGHTTCNVLLPLITREIFGQRAYAEIWGFLSGCTMMGYAIGSPIWGRVYDSLGTYKPAVFVSPFTVMACALIIIYLVQHKPCSRAAEPVS